MDGEKRSRVVMPVMPEGAEARVPGQLDLEGAAKPRETNPDT
jgi:hypothetical protein